MDWFVCYIGGIFERLGTDLYHYATSFQGITFSPYVIPAVLGITGFSLILYDFLKRREKKKRMTMKNGNTFLLMLPTDF